MSIEERKVQLGVAVDATGAREGFDQVKAGARDMAQSVAQSGQQAGKGVDAIGAGADTSAQKIDRATRSIISQIERTTAVMEAGGRGSAKYYETLAAQRGVSGEALKPYLAQLDAAHEKQKLAQGSINNMGMSAAQLSNNLRNVPAQFTDIVVSLQGGQRPMTVLLQQGGQLKDMFGGAGNAARVIGGYVLGLVTPITLAAGAAAALGAAFYQGAEESRAMEKALIASGNAAAVTVGQLQGMTRSLSESVGGTRGGAADVLTQMVATGKVAAGQLAAVSAAAIEMQRAGGQSIAETVKQFESLGKSPVDASLKLSEQTRYLTAEVYAQIKALEAQGKVAEAAALAQTTYAASMHDVARQLEQQLGTIETAWRGVKDLASGAWDAMLNVGREGGFEEKLVAAREKLAAGGGWFGGKEDAALEVRVLEAAVEAQQQRVALAAEAQKQEAAGVKWIQEGEKYLSKRQQIEQDIVRIRTLGLAAGIKEEDIQKRIAAYRSKTAEKSVAGDSLAAERDAAKAWAKFMQDMATDTAKATAATQNWTAAETKMVALIDSGAFAKLGEQTKIAALMAFDAANAAERQVREEKSLAAALKARADYMGKLVGDEERSAAGHQKTADALREELALLGMSSAEVDAFAASKLEAEAASARMTAAELEAAAALLNEKGELTDVADEYLRLAAAKRASAAALGEQAGLGPVVAEARRAAEAWERFSRDIEQSLTDALYRSFEAGGDFGETFARNLENTFKTMALKAAIQYVVSYAGNAASAFVGGATNGAAGNASAAAGQWGGTLVSAGGRWVYQQASPYVDSTANYIGSLFGGGSAAVGTYAGYGTGIAASSSSGGLASSVYGSSMANATPAASSSAAAGASGTSWLPIIGWIIAGMTASNELSRAGYGYGGAVYNDLGDKTRGLNDQSVGNTLARLFSNLGIDDRTSDILSAAPIDNNAMAWLFDEDFAVAGSGLQLGIRDGKLANGYNYQDWWSGGGRFHGSESGTNYANLSADQSALIAASLEGIQSGFIDRFNEAFETDLALNFDFRAGGATFFAAIEAQLVKGIAASDVKDLFVGITDASGMMAAMQSFANVQTMLAAINQQADIKSAGTLAVGMGSEQLTASLSGYYEAFFSEQEKAQKRADDLAKNWQQNAAKFADPAAFWGVDHPSAELPKTEAEFRKLVEALDLTRESGREAFAYLMQIAPAFDQVASAAEAMAASAEESAARLAETAAREAERAAQEQAAMLARLADQRRQLEIQLMDVSGDTAGATAARRSDELGAIDPTLRGLQQQIFDALDSSAARAAAEALAQEQARTAEEQLRAQEQIRAGWQRVADSMLDTIDRLRGELIGGGERGFAAAQADFAIATAAARAGDQAAASSLPELARAVVDLGREVATSSLDQARLTAATLSSLSATVGGLSGYGIALPQFAVGTNFVPADMVAQIHQGERIIPAGDNARLMQSSDDLLNEVRALRAEVVSLRAETRAVVNNTFDAALVLRRVMPDSDALAVRVVT